MCVQGPIKLSGTSKCTLQPMQREETKLGSGSIQVNNGIYGFSLSPEPNLLGFAMGWVTGCCVGLLAVGN